MYKEYACRRPSDCSGPDCRFYLKPHATPTTNVWFTRQPIGKNGIGLIAKKMALDAQLPTVNRTNHSGRKMAIQTLLHAGILCDTVHRSQKRAVAQLLLTHVHRPATERI